VAGAAAAAGALAVSPGAYRRLRGVVAPGGEQLPEPAAEPGEQDVAAELWPAQVPAPAAVEEEEPAASEPAADYQPAPFEVPGDDDTQELRLRIDQTRARVRERAVAERRSETAGDAGDEMAAGESLPEEPGGGGAGDGGDEAGEQGDAPPPVEEWPAD
jgi:hypothetical protein